MCDFSCFKYKAPYKYCIVFFKKNFFVSTDPVKPHSVRPTAKTKWTSRVEKFSSSEDDGPKNVKELKFRRNKRRAKSRPKTTKDLISSDESEDTSNSSIDINCDSPTSIRPQGEGEVDDAEVMDLLDMLCGETSVKKTPKRQYTAATKNKSKKTTGRIKIYRNNVKRKGEGQSSSVINENETRNKSIPETLKIDRDCKTENVKKINEEKSTADFLDDLLEMKASPSQISAERIQLEQKSPAKEISIPSKIELKQSEEIDEDIMDLFDFGKR